MVPYSQRADLNLDEDRLKELTDSAQAVGVTSEELIARLAHRVQSDIDTALRGEYVVPFNPVPETIRWIHADLWREQLYLHRENMVVPPTVTMAADLARKALLELTEADGPVLDAPLTNQSGHQQDFYAVNRRRCP
jgi:hypothetical protein